MDGDDDVLCFGIELIAAAGGINTGVIGDGDGVGDGNGLIASEVLGESVIDREFPFNGSGVSSGTNASTGDGEGVGDVLECGIKSCGD